MPGENIFPKWRWTLASRYASIRLQEATVIHMIPKATTWLCWKVSGSAQTLGESLPEEETRGSTLAHSHFCGSPCAKRSRRGLGAAPRGRACHLSSRGSRGQAEESQTAGNRRLLEGRVEGKPPSVDPRLWWTPKYSCAEHTPCSSTQGKLHEMNWAPRESLPFRPSQGNRPANKRKWWFSDKITNSGVSRSEHSFQSYMTYEKPRKWNTCSRDKEEQVIWWESGMNTMSKLHFKRLS